MNRYHVYIMSNQSRTLYPGVTGNLEQRVRDHKSKRLPGFTAKYNCTHLVFHEEFTNVNEAIAAEKKIKGWLRAKKIALIETKNPHWEELSATWFSRPSASSDTCHAERSEASAPPQPDSSLRSE
jgi:putative endonuclease